MNKPLKYEETEGDLFDGAEDGSFFVEAISADFAMDDEVAERFNKKFDVKDELTMKYTNGLATWNNCVSNHPKGFCVQAEKSPVFAIVVKERSDGRATIQTVGNALISLREACIKHKVYKLAMPKIVPELDWKDVSAVVKDVFRDGGFVIRVTD